MHVSLEVGSPHVAADVVQHGEREPHAVRMGPAADLLGAALRLEIEDDDLLARTGGRGPARRFGALGGHLQRAPVGRWRSVANRVGVSGGCRRSPTSVAKRNPRPSINSTHSPVWVQGYST